MEKLEFMLRIVVMDLLVRIKQSLVIVYGATQLDRKEEFLTELAMVCSDQNIPLLLGGAFNLIRSDAEKNTMI